MVCGRRGEMRGGGGRGKRGVRTGTIDGEPTVGDQDVLRRSNKKR